MPGPFAPSDPLVGAVMSALATAIQTQIPTIDKVYTISQSRQAPDNQVKLIFNRMRILDDTNGKVKASINITARHLFRLTEYSASAARAQAYVYPWLQFITAWKNQNLTSNMIVANASDIQLTQVPESGVAMVGLLITFDIVTEFNIVLS